MSSSYYRSAVDAAWSQLMLARAWARAWERGKAKLGDPGERGKIAMVVVHELELDLLDQKLCSPKFGHKHPIASAPISIRRV